MQQCVTYFCLGRALRCAAVRLFAASPRAASSGPVGFPLQSFTRALVLQ